MKPFAILAAAAVFAAAATAPARRAIVVRVDKADQLRELQRHEADFSDMLRRQRRGDFQPTTRRDI